MRWLEIAALAAFAAGVAHAEVSASNAWIRATAPGQKSAAGYLTLRSSDDAKVVGVSSPVAKSAGVHTTMNQSGVMHMHDVEALALPANKPVELKPGADHVMLMGIARPLKAGEQVPLVFTVEDARGHRSTLEVKARVAPIAE